MRYYLSFIFLLSLYPVFSQVKGDGLIHRITIEVESGVVNSLMNTPWVCDFCDCVNCYSYEPIEGEPASPIISPFLLAYLNFELNNKHQLGLGYSISQYGEMDWPSNYEKRAITYPGISLRHKWTLLDGKFFKLNISNAISFEKPKEVDFYILTKKGLSHVFGLGPQYQLSPKLGIYLNFVGRTALTEYATKAWYGMNTRWGYGATIGLQYKV